MRRFLWVAVFVGCQSKAAPAPVPSVTAAASAPVVSSARSIPPDAGLRRRLTVQEALDRWNDAHNRHDAHALESIYASRVSFYARSLTNTEVAAKKAAAFAKSPDFAQTLDNVSIYPTDPAEQQKRTTLVSFKKTSTSGGKSTTASASILIAPDGLVVFETDEPTNSKLGQAWFEAQSWCKTRPDFEPNDVVIAPYTISAKSVTARFLRSKYFTDLVRSDAGTFEIAYLECPTSCDRSAAEGCGYTIGIGDHDNNRFLYATFYVDAVTGHMNMQNGTWTETLPP